MVESPGCSGSPNARATDSGHQIGIGDRRQIDPPHTVVEFAGYLCWRPVQRHRVLPTPPAPVRVMNRLAARKLAHIGDLRLRAQRNWSIAPEDAGQQRFSLRRSGGNSLRRSGWHSCTTRSGRGNSTQGVRAQIGQPDVLVGSMSSDQSFRGTRQHGLAAVSQIAQPRGPVDGRAGVVAFVAELDLAGVHPDPQPDRGQAGPAGTPAHTATASEARANAATKLSPSPCSIGPHPVVGGDDLAHGVD